MEEVSERFWSTQTDLHRIDLIDIGDGANGDFDPQEEEHALLRLDVWNKSDGSLNMSIVTNLPPDASEEQRHQLLEEISLKLSTPSSAKNTPSL